MQGQVLLEKLGPATQFSKLFHITLVDTRTWSLKHHDEWRSFLVIPNLDFEEGIEFSPCFWMAAVQTVYQKLAGPTTPRETTERKKYELLALLAGYLLGDPRKYSTISNTSLLFY